MKLFQIHYADKYGECCGTLRQLYANETAANEAVHWYETHPMPGDMNLSYWVVRLDDDVADTFVPPMSEENYKFIWDECYPDQDEDDYPDDDYYPEPSEEELREHEETERLANELQEAEAKCKEEQERKNCELIEHALELCKEMGMKS